MDESIGKYGGKRMLQITFFDKFFKNHEFEFFIVRTSTHMDGTCEETDHY